MIQAAVELAKASDAVVLFMGIDSSIEREGLDRVNTTLPGAQTMLIEQVSTAAAGKPVVLVLLNGGMMSLGDLRGKVGVLSYASFSSFLAFLYSSLYLFYTVLFLFFYAQFSSNPHIFSF
jgi:hypothetical protein